MHINSINFDLNFQSPVIVIIGPPGAGKTAVGQQLADDLNWFFYDTDVLIENATAMTISEIFSQYTEKTFRQLECSLINKFVELLQTSNHHLSTGGTIISCGGGLPIAAENFTNLTKLGPIVCLQASTNILLQRIAQNKNRPLLKIDTKYGTNKSDDNEQLLRLEKLLSQRKGIYAQANYQIDTNNLSIKEIVKKIKTLLAL